MIYYVYLHIRVDQDSSASSSISTGGRVAEEDKVVCSGVATSEAGDAVCYWDEGKDPEEGSGS